MRGKTRRLSVKYLFPLEIGGSEKEKKVVKSETISNPAGNGNCEGYLEVKKGPEFNAYISCDNLYETSGYVSDSFTSVNLTNKN